MNPKPIPKILLLVLFLTLALTLSPMMTKSRANMGDPGGNLTIDHGRLSPVSGYAETSGFKLQVGSQPIGPLTYADFKQVEAQARAKLKRGLEARQALSPYRGNIEFTEYVTRFDYEAGWTREYTRTNPYGGTLTLMELIDNIEQDLRSARDLYGYLAVYAPEQRFRADPGYITAVPSGYKEALCGAINKENPDPADPVHSGQVLDPVIDWCDFTARLRQSVREAAYLRMIFGQQFMVDALGLQFSGATLLGAEAAVRQETARLRAAKYQYELAEAALNEALDRNLGSGCYISDFFQQSEWNLFSRAIEGQETAQHHLAVRLSYLDVPQEPDGPAQTRAAGVDALRKASTNGYVKLIGMAGLGAGQPTGTGCARGTRPDGALAAEMALNLAETRRKAGEMADGRNVFGFDVTFTPARSYTGGACGTAAAGLYQDAWCAAKLAEEYQGYEADANREYNQAQKELRTEVGNIRDGIDAQITDQSGCGPIDQDPTCVNNQIARLNTCLAVITSTVTTSASPFDTCINTPEINNSEAKRALLDLRGVFIQQYSLEKKAKDFLTRIQNSTDRLATVTTSMWNKNAAQNLAVWAEAVYNATSCIMTGASLTHYVWAGIACGAASGVQALGQMNAGTQSTAADLEIEGASNLQETKNLALDMNETWIDAYAAGQQFMSKYAEYTSLLDSLRDNVTEAQRQRAYFTYSPANDPSYRIVRDSTRLTFARQLSLASRLTYLAARRAEYEYAARLQANQIRYSDIYRARTAADLTTFLINLNTVTSNLPAGIPTNLNSQDLTFSVAQHWLNLTDAVLTSEGYTTPQAIQAERARRFRQWVATNTVPNNFESPYDGKPVLKFSFTTSLVEGGTFTRLIPQGYDGYWLITLSGIEAPKPYSNGMSMNLVTEQTGLAYRTTRVTQGGMMHLRSQEGCIFDYRLIAPAALLGLDWAENQKPEVATALFLANVNEETPYTNNGLRTEGFSGRAASTTEWDVQVFSGSPALYLSDMDLQKLTDIELNFSIVYASRTPGKPQPSACTRIDW